VNVVEKRPPTLAETLTSNSFPTIASPTRAALADYNGGAMSISVGNLNVSQQAGLTLQYRTRLGGDADVDADISPSANGTLSTTLSLPTLPAGDAITFRTFRTSVRDAYRRWFMTGYEDNFYTVSGTVTGLVGSVTLRLNGGNDLVVNAPSAFTFATSLANGSPYSVTIASTPSHQACGVPPATGVGTINGANITNVAVPCTNYSLAGQVTGLMAPGLVLQVNGGNDLAVPVGDTFAFPTSVSLSTPFAPQVPTYNIHIASQPTGQTCTITSGTGAIGIGAPNVTSPRIQCVANTTDPLSGTYRLTQLDGAPVTDFRAWLTLLADGTYMFGLHEDDPACGVGGHGGLEYGAYRWNQGTNAFALLSVAIDTNGECGLTDNPTDLLTGTLVKNSNGTLSFTPTDPQDSSATFTPVPSIPGTLIGSWGNNQDMTVFDANGTLFNLTTRAFEPVAAIVPGIEDGCYVLSGTTTAGSFTLDFTATCAVSGIQSAVDTNGPAGGMSPSQVNNRPVDFVVSGDTLTWYGGVLETPRITAN